MKKSKLLEMAELSLQSAASLAHVGETEKAAALRKRSEDLKLHAKGCHPDGPRDKTRSQRAKSLGGRRMKMTTQVHSQE